MVDLNSLKELRAAGVKAATFDGEEITSVEFFPRGLLEVDSLFPGAVEDGTPTERPPASPEFNERPIPPAIANIMKRGSVS